MIICMAKLVRTGFAFLKTEVIFLCISCEKIDILLYSHERKNTRTRRKVRYENRNFRREKCG